MRHGTVKFAKQMSLVYDKLRTLSTLGSPHHKKEHAKKRKLSFHRLPGTGANACLSRIRLLADARGNGDNDDGDRGFTGVEKNIDCVERVRKRTGTDTDEYNFVTNRTEIHRFRVSSTPFVSFPRKNSRRTILIDPETISRTESANCSKFSGSQEEGTSAGGIRGGMKGEEAGRLVSTTFRREFLWCRGVPCTEVRAGRADSITNGRSLR